MKRKYREIIYGFNDNSSKELLFVPKLFFLFGGVVHGFGIIDNYILTSDSKDFSDIEKALSSGKLNKMDLENLLINELPKDLEKITSNIKYGLIAIEDLENKGWDFKSIYIPKKYIKNYKPSSGKSKNESLSEILEYVGGALLSIDAAIWKYEDENGLFDEEDEEDEEDSGEYDGLDTNELFWSDYNSIEQKEYDDENWWNDGGSKPYGEPI